MAWGEHQRHSSSARKTPLPGPRRAQLRAHSQKKRKAAAFGEAGGGNAHGAEVSIRPVLPGLVTRELVDQLRDSAIIWRERLCGRERENVGSIGTFAF
jgi:hypothetical protein